MNDYQSDEEIFEDDVSEEEGDDMVEDENVSDGAMEIQGGIGVKKVKGGDPRYALPTPQEQSAMRQTAELMTSNILTLETNELLNEVKPKYKTSVEEYLRTFHRVLSRYVTTFALSYSKAQNMLYSYKSCIVPLTVLLMSMRSLVSWVLSCITRKS